MNDNFADFFIKKHRVKARKEVEAEERSQRVFSEYQQKIIDEHMKEAEGSGDDHEHFGPE